MPEIEIDGKTQRWPHSRHAQLEQEKRSTALPDLGPFSYLIKALLECGITQPMHGGGEIPLPWAEISAYSWSTGKLAEPWERIVVRKASVAYLEGKRDGRSPLAVSPLVIAERDGASWWTLQT